MLFCSFIAAQDQAPNENESLPSPPRVLTTLIHHGHIYWVTWDGYLYSYDISSASWDAFPIFSWADIDADKKELLALYPDGRIAILTPTVDGKQLFYTDFNCLDMNCYIDLVSKKTVYKWTCTEWPKVFLYKSQLQSSYFLAQTFFTPIKESHVIDDVLLRNDSCKRLDYPILYVYDIKKRIIVYTISCEKIIGKIFPEIKNDINQYFVDFGSIEEVDVDRDGIVLQIALKEKTDGNYKHFALVSVDKNGSIRWKKALKSFCIFDAISTRCKMMLLTADDPGILIMDLSTGKTKPFYIDQVGNQIPTGTSALSPCGTWGALFYFQRNVKSFEYIGLIDHIYYKPVLYIKNFKTDQSFELLLNVDSFSDIAIEGNTVFLLHTNSSYTKIDLLSRKIRTIPFPDDLRKQLSNQ